MRKATNERKFTAFFSGKLKSICEALAWTQSCGTSWCEANFIPINLYLGHQKIFKTYCFQRLMHPSFSANPTVSFKIMKPKRRRTLNILAAPTFRRNLRASSSAAGVPSTWSSQDHWGKCCFQNILKCHWMINPVGDIALCISFVSGYCCNM